jgi:hypothetical protein
MPSPARDGETQQFVLRQRPTGIEYKSLLIVEVGPGFVVEPLIGDRAVVIGLRRLVQPRLRALSISASSPRRSLMTPRLIKVPPRSEGDSFSLSRAPLQDSSEALSAFSFLAA